MEGKMEEDISFVGAATGLLLLAFVAIICYGIATVPFLTFALYGHLSWTSAWLFSAFNILWTIFWLSGFFYWLIALVRDFRRHERNRRRNRRRLF